ncbi:NET1-associated nuclear protein 1, partial [Cryomyces antarcticus]
KLRHKRKRDSKEQQPDASEQQSKRVKLGGKPQESESAIATIAKQSPPSIQESELNGPQTDVAVQEYQTTRVEREETQEGKTTKSEKKRKRRENEKAKTAENGTAVLGQDTVGSKQAVPVIALTCEGHKEGSSSKPHQNDDARVSTTNQDSGSVAEAKRGRRGRSKHSTAGGPTWNISRPVGGRFLSAEPIFTPDEKHLILATKRAVQIYSTSSSLLIRTITMTKSHAIAFYALSTLDSDNLYVATSSGSISLWNWVDGKKLTGWDTKSQIRGMATASTKEDAEDTIYTINKRDQRWSINAYRVRGELPDEAKVQHIALLQSSKPLRSFEVMDGGSHIVAAHTDSLSIGRITSMRNSELKDLRYAWLE